MTYFIGEYRLCMPSSPNDFQNHLYVGGHNIRMCQVDVKSNIYKRRKKYEIAKGVNGLTISVATCICILKKSLFVVTLVAMILCMCQGAEYL